MIKIIDKGCVRCGLISMTNQQNQKIEMGLSEIIFLDTAILVCPLCLNEIRIINIKQFDNDLLGKNLS